MTLSLAGQVWKYIPHRTSAIGLIAFAGVVLGVSVGGGIFIYVLIERPLLNVLRPRGPRIGHLRALWTGLRGRTIREAS